jgi:hypothetical protein
MHFTQSQQNTWGHVSVILIFLHDQHIIVSYKIFLALCVNVNDLHLHDIYITYTRHIPFTHTTLVITMKKISKSI